MKYYILQQRSLQSHLFLVPGLCRLRGTVGFEEVNELFHSCFLFARSLSAFSAYSSRPSSGPALPPLINSSLHKSHHSHTFSSFGQQSSSRTMLYRTFSQVSEIGACFCSLLGCWDNGPIEIYKNILRPCYQFRVFICVQPSNLARIVIHRGRNFLSVSLR